MADWIETGRSAVYPWNCDHYGHMNTRWYVHKFDEAGLHIWTMVGCGHAANRARGVETVAARFGIDFIREMTAGQLLVIRSGFTKLGNKSVTHLHRMFDADRGTLHASLECVEVFFDPEARVSAPMPDDIRAHLEPYPINPEEDWSNGLGEAAA